MKFKQKLALSLCVFYLFSVIGIAISMHFCGGKLASVAVYASKINCKFCKTELADKKDDSCCKNNKVEVKVKDSHQIESSFKLSKLVGFEILSPSKILSVVHYYLPNVLRSVDNKAPPSSSSVALHVFNCVFRI